jgi:hypothetical protein
MGGAARSRFGYSLALPSSGEPTPSGTILFDMRAGGAQDLQAMTTTAQVDAAFTATGGDFNDSQNLCTTAIDLNYNGSGKHAIRFDWLQNLSGSGPTGTDSTTLTYFHTPGPPSNPFCFSYIGHLGKTPTGGGLGSVGVFNPVDFTGGKKQVLFYRANDDGTDRLYLVWPAQDPADQNFTWSIDGRNFNDEFLGIDFGVGVDVRWTYRLTAASSSSASDGKIEVWRNGVKVIDEQHAAGGSPNGIGNLGFQQVELCTTRRRVLQDESEYMTDLVAWKP